jgi:hypothetical protein
MSDKPTAFEWGDYPYGCNVPCKGCEVYAAWVNIDGVDGKLPLCRVCATRLHRALKEVVRWCEGEAQCNNALRRLAREV